MKNTQNINILKKFQAGEFSEAIVLCADELKKDALNETIRQNLIKAKDQLEKSSDDDTSKTDCLNKVSALQSFFNINLTGKFRQLSGGGNSESPISGIKETKEGDIIISDDFNHRVQVYDHDYKLKFSFGQKGNNVGEFYYPKGIEIDSEGNIYVADSWNHRIQKFNKNGKFASTFGSYGNKPARLNEPVSIAINDKSELLVVDRCNHRIQYFDEKENYLGSIGHRGRVIEEDLAELFETPFETFSFPSLEFPSDIAIDSKNDIYIVDSHNHRILKFNSNGNFILSFGRQGKGHGEFLYPQSMAIDQFDNIFVSDLNNNRIQFFSPVGEHYFSFSRNGSKENIESPTVLACGKDNSLFTGFAFDAKVLTFKYHPVSQTERYDLKEKISTSTANSLFFRGNIFNRDRNWTKAIEKYEKALSIISTDAKKTVFRLPLSYLYSTQKTQKEDISPSLFTYYDEELNRLYASILDIYKKRKDITEKLIDPTLESEKTVLNEKLPSGEIDKNLYELNREERTLFRQTREIFLQLKRINSYQAEMFHMLSSRVLLQQDNNGIKYLLQQFLSHFYIHLNMLNSFLNDHDLYNSKCFEEIQKGDKGSFNLREFRSAFELMNVSDDFIQLDLPIVKSIIHALARLAMQSSASKTNSNIDLFDSLIKEDNIKKLGTALFKLRYDFTAILQLKESIRVLFSCLKLNSDEIISNFLKVESFNKDLLLNKDNIHYENDLIELLLVEELGIIETKKGLGIGLFCFTDSSMDSFQSLVSTNEEEKYGDLLNNLKNSIDQILSEKKEIDLLSLKHESSLKSIRPGDQSAELRITYEYNLLRAQSAFGNKLILEHFFLYRLINFKRCLYLLLDSVLTRKSKNEKRIEEIFNKITIYCNKFVEVLKGTKNNLKQNLDDLILCQNNMDNLIESSSETDRVKEIDASNRLFQLNKDRQLFEILNSEYASILNIQNKIKQYFTHKNLSKMKSTVISDSLELHHDLQFGSLGNNNGQFYHPSHICSNIKGDIFVSDKFNHRIQKFTTDGNHIFTFGCFGDFKGFFNKPHGILCDENNNLLVCDFSNHRIQKFDSNGNYLMSWGTFGDKTGCFNRPFAICQDNEGFLYITDMKNYRIQKFTPDGKFVLFFGKQGKNDGEFSQPVAVSYSNNLILVGELTSDKIQIFNKNGDFVKSFNYSKETTPGLQGTSNICTDKEGHIYISEFFNNNLYVLSEEFSLITSISSSDNLQILFNGPCGVTFSGKYMFLCDYFNHRIHRFNH